VRKANSSRGLETQGRLRLIEGKHNAAVKELRRAFARGELTEDGYCAVEGLRIAEEAIRSGLKLRSVFFSRAASARAERLLPQIGAHVETLLLPDEVFASAVPSETPQGVAALVRMKKVTLDDILAKADSGPLLAVSGLQDPGNLGTILRSAEAFRAAGVLLGTGTVSPYNSKVVRASAGSVFRVPVAAVDLETALEAVRARGIRLLATSSHKGVALEEADLSRKVMILVGSEGAGVPRDLLSQADEVVAIRHSPQVESLNAGVAASIVLYEAAKQRRALEEKPA